MHKKSQEKYTPHFFFLAIDYLTRRLGVQGKERHSINSTIKYTTLRLRFKTRNLF